MNVFLASLLIVAVAVALLSVRLICGKKTFVNTHIEGNASLKQKGITCAKEWDGEIQKINSQKQ